MINRIYKSAAKAISASKFGAVNIGGSKLSGTKFKEHILEKIKAGGVSERKLEEVLKSEGLGGSQISKRRRIIKMLTGNDTVKLSKKEERRMAERVKMRIAAARRSSEMGEGKPSMASSLMNRKGKKEALGRALENEKGEKTGMGSLGISGPSYSVTSSGSTSGPGPSSGGTSTGQSAPPIGFNKMG